MSWSRYIKVKVIVKISRSLLNLLSQQSGTNFSQEDQIVELYLFDIYNISKLMH